MHYAYIPMLRGWMLDILSNTCVVDNFIYKGLKKLVIIYTKSVQLVKVMWMDKGQLSSTEVLIMWQKPCSIIVH